MTETVTVDWSAVKGRFIDSVRNKRPWRQAAQHVVLDEAIRNPNRRTSKSVWQGGTGGDTLGWLDTGYYSDDLTVDLDVLPVAEDSYVGWHDEEGDVDAGRLLGGYDEFYLNVEPSERQPGLKLEIDLFFAAKVEQPTVGAYASWVISLISGLERAGYDLDIGALAPIRNLYGERGTKRTDVQITVKRAGEMSDFTEWSALFGPTGTRHLLFVAFGVAAESIGKRQTDFMCSSLASHERPWNVIYDAESNTLRVHADQRASSFDADYMSQKLRESGLI